MRFLTFHLCRRDYAGLMFELTLILTVGIRLVLGLALNLHNPVYM